MKTSQMNVNFLSFILCNNQNVVKWFNSSEINQNSFDVTQNRFLRNFTGQLLGQLVVGQARNAHVFKLEPPVFDKHGSDTW